MERQDNQPTKREEDRIDLKARSLELMRIT